MKKSVTSYVLPAAELPERYRALRPHEIVMITCIDYRESPIIGYRLTSAGCSMSDQVREDIRMILPGTKLLLLQCHTDCVKSKAEVRRKAGESDERYRDRVEDRTLIRLWRAAGTLLQDLSVQSAMRSGMDLVVARHVLEKQIIEYHPLMPSELCTGELRLAA